MEPLHTRQRHHPGGDALGFELLGRGERDLQLGTGTDQDHLGLGGGLLEHVAAQYGVLGAGQARTLGTVQGGHVLPGQDQRRRVVLGAQDLRPGVRGLVGVTGAHHVDVRHQPQAHHVLDRLMGRAVLADTHRVVRPDERGRHMRQRGQPRRRPHVVGEHQEGGAVDPGQAVHGDAVGDVAHGVLTDAEVQRAATGSTGELVAGPLGGNERVHPGHRGVVRTGQVGRSAPQLGHRVGQRRQHLAGRGTGGHRTRLEDRQRGVQIGRGLLGEHPVEQLRLRRVGRTPRLEPRIPLGAQFLGASGGIGPGGVHHRGIDGERLVLETELGLQRADLGAAQLGPVHTVIALLVRQRPADDRGHLDEVRLVGDLLGPLEDVVQLGDLLLVGGEPVGEVDVVGVPAVRGVTGLDVLGEGDLGVALDRDPVVVVDQEQVAQILGGGQRRRLTRDALLHAAVAGDAVHVVIEHRLTRSGLRVVQLAGPAGAHREADRVAHTGTQRARGALNALGQAELGVARRQRIPGAQALDVIEFEAETVQVQLGVLGERRVTRRHDEAVTTQPTGIGRIRLHQLRVQQVRDRRQRNRRARVTVADLLDGIGSQNASDIDGLRVLLRPRQIAH